MSEQVWYLYQNGQQVGPFDNQQVNQLIINKMISQDGFIFKVGWKDWRPLEEGLEELGVKTGDAPAPPTPPGQAEDRRKDCPRATVAGRVVVHNNGQLTIGQGVNISSTGIFVETTEELFNIGEQLKLSVRCEGLEGAFNAEAVVIRYSSDSRYPVGYGMQFVTIPESSKLGIEQLVKKLNSAI